MSGITIIAQDFNFLHVKLESEVPGSHHLPRDLADDHASFTSTDLFAMKAQPSLCVCRVSRAFAAHIY